MSDYEVSLVNDNMQEFYVRFYGPAESELRFLCVTQNQGRSLSFSFTTLYSYDMYGDIMAVQHRLQEAYGRFTSNYPTSIPSSHLASDS